MKNIFWVFLRVTLFALACATTSFGDDTSTIYKGKQITLISGSAVGGGNDFYSRLVALHLPEHITGTQVVIVQNMPGATGVRSAQYLYNVAPHDGLTIGMVPNNLAFMNLFEGKSDKFDATKFNWLGSPSQETGLLVIWHTVPVDSIEDAKSRELILGGDGPASTPAFYGRVLSAVLGIKVRTVNGYSGQPDVFLAMERGENEGYASSFWSSLKSGYPEWITENKIKILVQYGAHPHPDLKNVPFAPDLIKNPDDRLLMEIASAPLALGRPALAPPGVPVDRVTYLRRALQAEFEDPRFLADCSKQRLECDNPATGEEIAAVIASAYSAPQDVISKLRQINLAGTQ